MDKMDMVDATFTVLECIWTHKKDTRSVLNTETDVFFFSFSNR